MNLNKCERCGCFFVSNDCVCPNCIQKDNNEISRLTSFLSENDNSISITDLAKFTGIPVKNVNRFLKNQEINSKFTNLGLISDNIELNL